MYRLAARCLLLLGCLRPLLCVPAPHAGDGALPPAAADGGGSARGELDSASLSLLRGLLGTPGAESAEGLRTADPGTSEAHPRGNAGEAFPGRGAAALLHRLLARLGARPGKRGHPSECFWKYCV